MVVSVGVEGVVVGRGGAENLRIIVLSQPPGPEAPSPFASCSFIKERWRCRRSCRFCSALISAGVKHEVVKWLNKEKHTADTYTNNKDVNLVGQWRPQAAVVLPLERLTESEAQRKFNNES